jgi:hypothetical protein
MSSKKRRIARKIALIVRMDVQQASYGRDCAKRDRVIAATMALGRRLTAMGYKERGWAAIEAARAGR